MEACGLRVVQVGGDRTSARSRAMRVYWEGLPYFISAAPPEVASAPRGPDDVPGDEVLQNILEFGCGECS